MHIDSYVLTFSAIMVFATITMGFWSAKKSKTASDFFVAGRSVSVGWNASAISGEYLSAASFMGIAGMVMSSGYDALWYPVCYACGYLFLLLFIAGPLRRFGAYTIPDFAEGRFDSPLFRKIAVCFVLFIGFFYTMPQMKGAGVALAYIFPGLPYWAGVALVGVVITFNVALGGMKGITLVQAFQYWAKMFAISVPIFILMSVYGQYGSHLEQNKTGYHSQPPVAIESTHVTRALPEKAPKDESWISPFGPLTTKAAKTANATPRWNLTSENRSALRDEFGRPVASGIRKVLQAIGARFDKAVSNQTKQPQEPMFARWTNMASNTSMRMQMSPLLAISELGDLLGKPVYLATNLNRAPITFEGSFHSRDELVRYVGSTLSSNGIEIDINQSIHAVAASDWSRYKTAPTNVNFVEDKLFTMFFSNAPPATFIRTYGELTGKKPLMATDLPDMTGEFNVPYQVLMRHEALAGIEKKIASMGVTIIPVSDKECWAIPTTRIAQYQAPPINVRLLSLLYTYSLIIALVCGTAGLPHILVRFYTNPDGVAAKRTTMWVMILIGVFYLFPPVFGVMARNLMPDLYNGLAGVKGTDGAVLKLPKLLNEKWPPLGSILSGITCAGAFAAFMSTFSGLLVSMTGALAHDVYGRILKPSSTPQDRMRMFKLCAIICGTGAVLLGLLVETFEINKMVGWAFAIAATSYFPLLFLSTWWRGITMKGAATGMLCGGLLSLSTVVSTMLADQAAWAKPLADYYTTHPLLRILAEQPAIWALPLAIGLMIVVSKLTSRDVPNDIRMKMLVLHAPEKLGLKQEYIHEAEVGH